MGCDASREEVATRLGAQYVGQNVDALVIKFGPPASTFKMNSGDTSYIWQLGNQTNISTDRGSGIASTQYCKVSVIASKTGIVSQFNIEDSNAGAGLGLGFGNDPLSGCFTNGQIVERVVKWTGRQGADGRRRAT